MFTGRAQRGWSDRGVIETFARQALEGAPLTVHGDGTQTHDFVFVDDIVQANLRAGTTDAAGQAVNVETGVEGSVIELAEPKLEITETNSTIDHTDPHTGDVQVSRADISAAKAGLNYEPTGGFKEGLETVVNWYDRNVIGDSGRNPW